MITKLNTLFRIFLTLVFAVLVLALVFTFIASYDELINWAIQVSGYSPSRRYIVEEALSPSRIILLQSVLVLLLAILPIIFYFSRQILNPLIWFLSNTKHAVVNIWSDLNPLFLLVLALPVLASIYFGFTVPVSYDEAYTYLNYTSKPFFYSMIVYPVPNNHVLHSVLTNVTEYIPFLPTLFLLRLVAIAASFLTSVVAYSFVKRYYSEKLALLVVGIASALFMVIYYSFMARGYSMLCLFFVIAFYATFNIIRKGNRSKDWAFFAVSSIFGFYTIPSFLYPFITLNVLILIFNYKNIKEQVLYNALTVLGVLLLYIPIIAVSGIDVLIANKFVLPISRLDVLYMLPNWGRQVLEEMFLLPSYIALFIIVGGFIFSFLSKSECTTRKNSLPILWLLFLSMPFVLLLIHSVLPFPRIFVYYGFVFIFLIGITFRTYIDKLPFSFLVISICLIQAFSFFRFDASIATKEGFNTLSKECNDLILRESNKTYFIASSLGKINFGYEHCIRGYSADSITISKRDKTSADTITNYDYVVIDTKYDETIDRKPIFRNNFQTVYTR